ncbi:MAG TPA: NAD(+)/NADH kinase [Nitrospiria bacterium]|nr:NAD(+)/NADH kinase [Nitrospiria bacterium]
MKAFTKIGLIAKPLGAEIKPVVEALVPWLKEQEKEVFLDADTAQVAGLPATHQKSKIPGLVDMIIVLGGDGTLLSVARLIEQRDVPILGVNLGGLGFLTEVTLDTLYPTLEQVFQQRFIPQERLLLKAEVLRQGETVAQSYCLNDTVISKGFPARMIKLETSIDGQFLTALRGDGLIIASPTGSTAYSLSSGGPIVHPAVDALLFTPICPHTLTNRPIVIPAMARMEVVIRSADEGAALVTFDGQVGVHLRLHDVVAVTAAEHRIKLFRSPTRSDFQVWRTKLKWGGE